MNIYIDESGIFSNPHNKPHCVSCVAALVIPEKDENSIFQKFQEISSCWRNNTAELKGRDLNEPEVAEVIKLLKDYHIILEVCAIDVAIHTNDEIQNHKSLQSQELVKNITDDFHPKLIEQLNGFKTNIANMPNQLYAQFISLTELVNSTLRSSILYYSQIIPETLKSFNWVIDAKDQRKTLYENMWSILAMGFLQSVFLNDPIRTVDKGDLSALERFTTKTQKMPEHLKQYAIENLERSFQFDLKKILTEKMSFMDSSKSLGLRLADILANAIYRAFNGNLKKEGWGEIGSLMLKKFKGEHSIKSISLKPGSRIIILSSMMPYYDVFKTTDRLSRSSLPGANRNL